VSSTISLTTLWQAIIIIDVVVVFARSVMRVVGIVVVVVVVVRRFKNFEGKRRLSIQVYLNALARLFNSSPLHHS
jgi:hypothetical protein